MAWNITLLAIVGFFLILTVGGEFASSPIEAEALAERVAPQLGVSEADLREDLREVLMDGAGNRAVVRAGPWLLLTVLLTVRLIQDQRATRSVNRAVRGT